MIPYPSSNTQTPILIAPVDKITAVKDISRIEYQRKRLCEKRVRAPNPALVLHIRYLRIKTNAPG